MATVLILSACSQTAVLSQYEANLEIVKKTMACYEAPTDVETFKSLIHKDIKHQSPMYGQGLVDYNGVIGQAEFYMSGFEKRYIREPNMVAWFR